MYYIPMVSYSAAVLITKCIETESEGKAQSSLDNDRLNLTVKLNTKGDLLSRYSIVDGRFLSFPLGGRNLGY